MLTRAGLLVLWLLRLLPLPLLAAVGNGFGTLLYALGRERRRVCLTNLARCMPALSASERDALARRHFQGFARTFLERAILWWGTPARVRQLVRIEGMEHFEAVRSGPLILLAPHFVGLDAGGMRISTEHRVVSIYARQSNPVWDRQLATGRARFNQPVLIARRGFDLRKALRAMQEGLPFYYLPDMDNGDTNSIFVPFFGVPAATLPMVSRLARGIGARVLMAVTEQTDTGYVLHIEPPWEDFPGASIEEDTARMNREIERWVRRMPDQYLWTHRRFKTRPPGATPIYK
jgi:KDO2-lipid IV(A) lauroyltransferase